MSRLLDRSFSAGVGAVLSALLAVSLLAGCSTPAAVADFRYDLGPATPSITTGTLPAIKVLEVTAPQTLDSDHLVYRLGYADAQRLSSYSNSHWTMAPAQLLTQRLRAALSSRGTVLTGADGVRAPVLKIDLEEFEQVFDGQAQSHGAVTARATLIQNGKVIGQHTFVARAPASSPDAAGGAAALAAASNDLIAQIAAWLGVQPLVAAQ
ncbi:ABC-type transport auxiliary lipoprotein family protein [Paraburkholderia megapolitana]|uniref:Cholesterol transport system auxiliary component n=1 Tax=Paraburkholderia megapolitana TaxID=420953 RepID=A0A1I3FWD6_9BURK|nr:ABC-type transport auxiliary lipoprotein family protein [Paraburkholderia megapolitana]QDQ82583.1 ABC transporter [Paraburkholderia megapolitana]SFI15499.1 cholesterol transport system auxiliary component [Paraburkholderia megapolitana]